MSSKQVHHYKALYDLKHSTPNLSSLSLADYKTWNTETWKFIADSFPNLKELSVSCKYSDHPTLVDVQQALFPELISLTFNCCGFKAIHFDNKNTPKLRRLEIQNSNDIDEFQIELSDLEELEFQFVVLNKDTGVAPSFAKCPKLKTIRCYKLGGLGWTPQVLNLPECTYLSLYRSDTLSSIEVNAPKLQEFGLRACYMLKHVRLLPNEGSDVSVDLINANIDPTSWRHLKNHPRVKSIKDPDFEERAQYGGPEYQPSDEEVEEETQQQHANENDNSKKIRECHVCNGTENLKYCGRCKKVKYCSLDCQKQDWPTHKPQCTK